MQPPIPPGTVLQNRYRLLSVLGQGGFGRTYLAEDQGRFNELCALKELTPAQGGPYALDKSKELFQREAQILYQIQHPQVPQFRATFEQDQRLFLVQDYVEGKTYRDLLNDRKAQGYAFSETEVLQLMQQTLPVLAYLHSKGIIHRDIAPDNIILREQDRLPVLIDFGVVKELATRFQGGGTAPQATTVGKFGYAPSEQIQTGQAYPNSDLYSLAVTALVLLTGREPQELFDSRTMTWNWQQRVTVSPLFAQVLNRMLSYKPGDRYASAAEVMQVLQTPGATVNSPPPPPFQPSSVTPPSNPDVSRMPTMAVGRRPEPVTYNVPSSSSGSTRAQRPDPVINTRSSLWDDPWAVGGIALGLVILTGVGSYTVANLILNRNQNAGPSPSPTETVTASPSPTVSASPSPSPTTQPVTYSQRLDVAPGTPLSRRGSLKANETLNFIVPGQQGQQMSAVLNSEGVLMSVLGPNQEPVDDRARRVSLWQGTLPYTGDYFLQLRPVQGLPKGDFKLDVNIQNPASPSPSPTDSPSPSPSQSIETERISFAPGTTEAQVSGSGNPAIVRRYLVNAKEGQVLNVELRNGAATLSIRYPDGRLVEDAAGVVFWQAQLTRSGDYQIDVISSQDTSFDLRVSVRN